SRFEGDTDRLADSFSFSIDYDYRLGLYDCIGGIAHAKMLGDCEIIPKADARKIARGLQEIAQEIEEGLFQYDSEEEDVHSNIQSALKEKIGPAADKLHTARSRNDLIVLDMKLYCLVELNLITEQIGELQRAILDFAKAHKHIIIPAYTHLQSAQVVLLAQHMLAYIEMLERDKQRIGEAVARMDSNPLGSCALSGTTLPTDRKQVSTELGFAATTRNSIDSVSDRDFIIEALADLSILGMHFSRMAEDMIIWATSEFHFINIDWSLCTGSSIMPHKKNPDILELVRGETATIYGNLNKLLVLLKGLPLTYNRDLQLDKPPLFESVEQVQLMLPLLSRLFASLEVKEDNIRKQLDNECFFSVDIMEYLITKGVSYREAHDAVGKLVRDCIDKGKKISGLENPELKEFHPKLNTEIRKLLNPEASVKGKKSAGSTSPSSVNQQLRYWEKRL
ncbi:MAG: argininosuccinate lyase, partial [Candidatus Omnitrophica bacterium]|nr:argininosuccinate lyase [Candidatus Omnitrophota bacterium]